MATRVGVILGAGAAVVLAAGIGYVALRSAKPVDNVKLVFEEDKSRPPAPAPSPASPKEATSTEPATPKPSTPPPAPTTGTLRIQSDVPDTSVFIDRVYLGTAPVTAKNLTPGTHHLNMSAKGYDGISEDIDVAAGTSELSKSFKTVKLDAKLDVVHKHSFGSCKGTLHATPQGITYETTNKDDGFTVALTDLETFEVDYLNKFMTIKTRKGKSFKFTDPEDNPDRLYAFHQEVDKVRKKLGVK